MRKVYLKLLLALILLFLLLPANICFAAEFKEIKKIYGYLIGVGAGLALLAVIWGGIRLLMSRGDKNAIVEAKKWLISGFTGLLIIGGAGAIYKSISGEFPSFEIKFPETLKEIPEAPLGPGVYFYTGPNCKNKKIKEQSEEQSFKIINGKEKEYAVVIKNKEGKCSKVYSKAVCHTVNFEIKSPQTFQLNLGKEAEKILAGTEVVFYRRPYFLGKYYTLCEGLTGWGKMNISDIEPLKEKNLADFKINEEPCGSLYSSNISCLGSLKIKGPYAVVLYNEKGHCEIYTPQSGGSLVGSFKESRPNLKLQKTFSRSKPLKITIIPIKF